MKHTFTVLLFLFTLAAPKAAVGQEPGLSPREREQAQRAATLLHQLVLQNTDDPKALEDLVSIWNDAWSEPTASEPTTPNEPNPGEPTTPNEPTTPGAPPDTGPVAPGQPVSQITDNSITWSFDANYPAGQYANGDWWIVGPVRITSILPRATGRARDGSEINPSPRNWDRQGFDSSMLSTRYDATLNVASRLPQVVATGSSLVSGVSRDSAGVRPQLLRAAVLTVVSTKPPVGSFRPPYSGSNKSSPATLDDVHWELLRDLPSPTPLPATIEIGGGNFGMIPVSPLEAFDHVWLDHMPQWIGREVHPLRNMPAYGADIANAVGVASMLVHTKDYPDKDLLAIRLIQFGIDAKGIIDDGGGKNYLSGGGHGQGRLWPVIFAGLMLDRSDMKDVRALQPGVKWAEVDQTFLVSAEDLQPNYGNYLLEDVGSLYEWGSQHDRPAYEKVVSGVVKIGGRARDDRRWTVPMPKLVANTPIQNQTTQVQTEFYLNKASRYRRCCTASSWWGFLLAADVMDAENLWSHPASFGYQDRYSMQEGTTRSRWVKEMWDLYRSNDL